MWQGLYGELAPQGVEIVTVALDTDVEAARPFHAAAAPTHPSLVDPALSLVERFGITNVPFGMWIDEAGTIVRPPEVAFVGRPPGSADDETSAFVSRLPPEQRAIIDAMTASVDRSGRYTEAVRDWAAKGSASRFVMAPDAVVSRSRPLPAAFALAAAHFALGEELHRRGFGRDAVAHFAAAHRLDPENWSYKRDAFSVVDPAWGQVYERDLLSDVAAVGPVTFYPPLEL